MSKMTGIIPAGGSGTRLWPLSRASEPKFLLPLFSGKSLLQLTWNRLQEFCDEIIIVAGRNHGDAILSQLDNLDADNLLLEPSGRNTMPALAWACAVAAARDPETIIGSFAADHLITDEDEFVRVARRAIHATGDFDLVTIGLTPTSPSTAFGYIETESDAESEAALVLRFTEKPNPKDAERFFESGNHLWNAGMFFAKADTFLSQLQRLHPDLSALGQAMADQINETLWLETSPLAIDYALAEPLSVEGKVGVVRGDFGFNDLGDFAALAEHQDSTEAYFVEGSGFVQAQKPVAIVGLENAIVIETEDAILVTTESHAQDVGRLSKVIPEQLR